MQKHIDRYQGRHHPHIVEMSKLKVALPDKSIVNICETPHYQYMLGDHDIYMKFLDKHYLQHSPFEHQLQSLDILMNDDSDYLDEKFHDGLIIHKNDFIIMDGVHRAARLLHLGINIAVVLEYMGGIWDAEKKIRV